MPSNKTGVSISVSLLFVVIAVSRDHLFTVHVSGFLKTMPPKKRGRATPPESVPEDAGQKKSAAPKSKPRAARARTAAKSKPRRRTGSKKERTPPEPDEADEQQREVSSGEDAPKKKSRDDDEFLTKAIIYAVPVPKQTAQWNVSAAGYLPELCEVLLSRLKKKERDALDDLWNKYGEMTFGTICAGSESPAVVLAVLSRSSEGRIRFRHKFSSEMNGEKREFIEKVFPDIPCLFAEVQDLIEKKAISHHKGNKQQIPKMVPGVHIAFIGFPCKDVSSLNANRKHHANVVAEGGSKTGSALQGSLDYIDVHGDELLIVFLENVLGLHQRKLGGSDKWSNLEVCCAEMKKRNFVCFVLQLDPRSVAGCQSRGRFWIPCVRKPLLDSLGWTEAGFRQQLCDIVLRFSDAPTIPVENILLPDDDPLVKEHLRKAARKIKRADVLEAVEQAASGEGSSQ